MPTPIYRGFPSREVTMRLPKTIIRIPKHIANALGMYKSWAARASTEPLEALRLSSKGLPLEITYRETSVRLMYDLKENFVLHEMTLRWEGFRADVTIEVHDSGELRLHEVKTREGSTRTTYDRDKLKPSNARWPDDLLP